MARNLLQTSALISLALLLSRLSGFVREQVLGARLGLGAEADAAILILTLPDLLVGLLLSGGFGAALIPVLARQSAPVRIQLVRRVLLWVGAVALGIAVLLILGMPVVLDLLAPSLDSAVLSRFRLGFALSLLALPVAATIGVASAYLNATGRYALPAISVLVFNGLLALYFYVGLPSLADPGSMAIDFTVFGMVLLTATVARLAVQSSRMTEVLTAPAGDPARFAPGFRSQFAAGVLAYSLIVGVPILFRSIYALDGTGALAEFNFALRLFELPMGILIAPIPIIFLPLLSRLPVPNGPEFAQTLRLAVRIAFTIGATAAIMGSLFASPVSALLFGYGAMAGERAESIAKVARILFLAVPPLAVFQTLAAGLNAHGQTQRVLRHSLSALGGALLLVGGLHQGFGITAAPAALTGFAAFYTLACLLGLLDAFGAAHLPAVLSDLGLGALRLLCVALPVALLVPETRDSTVTGSDLVLIPVLGLVLLGMNARNLANLARLRAARS